MPTVVSGPACFSVTSKVFERDETHVQSESALDRDLTGGAKTSSAGLSLIVGDGKWLPSSGIASQGLSSSVDVTTLKLAAIGQRRGLCIGEKLQFVPALSDLLSSSMTTTLLLGLNSSGAVASSSFL